MRFEASVKELQKAIKDLEKASKNAAKKQPKAKATNQMDMFSFGAPSNDIDVDTLKKQLDDAIQSVETVLKEAS
jgi:hypothetical protein